MGGVSDPVLPRSPDLRADDVTGPALEFDDLGYADRAPESYATCADLKRADVVPAHVRSQVDLPSPLFGELISAHPDVSATIASAYERGLRAEAHRLAEHRRAAVERLSSFSPAVPADVQLGYPLCFGEVRYRNGTEPEVKTTVDIANAITAEASRPVTWFHMPVPRGRNDVEYFAPLRSPEVPDDTEPYLGLVHEDELAADRARIDAAATTGRTSGIATECGFGRRPSSSIPAPFARHEAVAMVAAA